MKVATDTFKFLKELKGNNNREWFNENKERYQESQQNLIDFLTELIPKLGKIEPRVAMLEPKSCIFRIYRDVRFSKNKSPYKTHLGAHMVPKGGKGSFESAGYYIHIEPGNCFLAGGAHHPQSEWLGRIRDHIAEDASGLKKVLNSSSFKKYFAELKGEKLKTVPRGYPKEHPDIDLLRFKSLMAVHYIPDKIVKSEDFLKYAIGVFKALKPFDDFLNK